MITVLAGGVGAARMLPGWSRWCAAELTAIVNIGDDLVLHGLQISPDLDTVTYTLAGAIDPERGWGLAGETWQAMDDARPLRRRRWFGLGDRDLGTHLYRTSAWPRAPPSPRSPPRSPGPGASGCDCCR